MPTFTETSKVIFKFYSFIGCTFNICHVELQQGICCGILTQVKISDLEGTVENTEFDSRSGVEIPILICL